MTEAEIDRIEAYVTAQDLSSVEMPVTIDFTDFEWLIIEIRRCRNWAVKQEITLNSFKELIREWKAKI